MTIYIFSGTPTTSTSTEVVLEADEIGYSTADGFKKGDGVTKWASLAAITNYAANLAFLGPWVAAPSTAASTGTAGQVAYDATHIYVCVATNTWVRATLATW